MGTGVLVDGGGKVGAASAVGMGVLVGSNGVETAVGSTVETAINVGTRVGNIDLVLPLHPIKNPNK
jgi:hypothetical protein